MSRVFFFSSTSFALSPLSISIVVDCVLCVHSFSSHSFLFDFISFHLSTLMFIITAQKCMLFLGKWTTNGLGHRRLLWITCICIAIFGTASLTQRTWNRFQTSPMVISMDRNKFVWNTSFPSLTVCPHKRIDATKLDDYMKFVLLSIYLSIVLTMFNVRFPCTHQI